MKYTSTRETKRKPDIESRWFKLFSTPERTARTLQPDSMSCAYCLLKNHCKDDVCLIGDYDVLVEWLEGDAE